MASAAEDDLQASKTEGFKVGEKKTLEEYSKLGTHITLLVAFLQLCNVFSCFLEKKTVQPVLD